MCNLTFLVFFIPTFSDVLPGLIVAWVLFWFFGIIGLIIYAKKRQSDQRAAMQPLCVWEYSATDWQKYADLYDLAKFPKGAARVQMTLLDVWIIDEGKVRRTILDDDRKCVTACKFENHILKFRIRAWAIPSRYGSVVYSVQDVSLPVPIGNESDANEFAKLVNENIARMNKKVISVMPDDDINGLLAEVNF